MSNLLCGGLLTILAGLGLLYRRDVRGSVPQYLILVATVTLGFLLFKTAIVSRYFVYSLPFLILCRASIRGPGYYAVVFVVSATTLLSMYGQLSTDTFSLASNLNSPLHPANSSFTRAVVDLYSADWAITAATSANLLVFVWLLWLSIRPVLRSQRTSYE